MIFWIELLAIAVALAIDAVVVALCWCASQPRVRLTQVVKFALVFGLFQAFMPVAGWFAGEAVYSLISRWDHWVAFALLAFVSFSMAKEAFEKDNDENGACECSKNTDISWAKLSMLAVATSLDALAVGFSYAMTGTAIAVPATVIGIVCAILTTMAMMMGRSIADRLTQHTKKFSLFGALVLLAIGVRILIEHGAL